MNMLKNIFEAENAPTIPNYYIYTSGTGNKYFKKGDNWYSVQTKKVVPSSQVAPLERSALKAIENYNSSNPVPVGQVYSANNGKQYTFNGSAFVSTDGKILSGTASTMAYNKLKAQIEAEKAAADDQSTDSTDGSDSIDDVPSGDSAIDDTQTPPAPTPDPAPAPNDQTPPPAPNNGGSELDQLAQDIKSNKYRKQLVTLISRGSTVDLIAADIILNGEKDQALSIINALNNQNN